MAKAYVQSRPDLADLAALIAEQLVTREYVDASIVMTNDKIAAICIDSAAAVTPFAIINSV